MPIAPRTFVSPSFNPRILLPLAGLLLLSACGSWQPFGRAAPTAPGDSLTMRRVMGQNPEFTPLRPESGNVWPAEEAPRATMANPEAMTPQPTSPDAPPPVRRRGSSSYPGDQPRVELPESPPANRPIPRGPNPPMGIPPGPTTQTVPVPGGAPVTTTGTGPIQSYTGPNGSGVAVPQGPTINLYGNDGVLRQVPAPR